MTQKGILVVGLRYERLLYIDVIDGPREHYEYYLIIIDLKGKERVVQVDKETYKLFKNLLEKR